LLVRVVQHRLPPPAGADTPLDVVGQAAKRIKPAEQVTGVVGGLEQVGHDVRFERPYRGGGAFQPDRGALAPGVASPELPAPGDVLEPHVAQFGEQAGGQPSPPHPLRPAGRALPQSGAECAAAPIFGVTCPDSADLEFTQALRGVSTGVTSRLARQARPGNARSVSGRHAHYPRVRRSPD